MKKIVNILGSAKFGAAVIFLIILCSLVGSFIPKSGIYSSIFFSILAGLFALNLFLCTLKLLPFALNGFSNYNITLSETGSSLLSENDFIAKLNKTGWKIDKSGSVYRAEKQATNRWGVIILHAGVIAVLIGALGGKLYGFNGFMNVLEGTSDDSAVLPSGELIPLGFDVRCDDFKVEYYAGTKRAKSYKSKITIIENGKEVKSADIDVNHPLKYKNTVFYQTNFGFYPSKNAKIRFNMEIDGKNEVKETTFGEMFKISKDYIGKITDFAPALAADKDGKIYSVSEEMINPAILIEIYDDTEPVLRGWVLKNKTTSGDFKELGLKIIFNDLWGVEYTGLSVKKDPGTPIVYAGFIFMFFGIVFIYCLNYTAIFFTIENNGSGIKVIYTIKNRRGRTLVRPESSFIKLFVI